MKNKFPACIAIAAFAIILFACSETDSQGSANQSSSGGNQQYTFCVYHDYKICSTGLTTECPAGGTHSNDCPSGFFNNIDPDPNPSSSSGQNNPPDQAERYTYCVIPEIPTCLKGPFAECPVGNPANECPDFSIENSSSSSNQNDASSSSNQDDTSSSSNQDANSSSSEDPNSLCKGFDPNAYITHQGKQKKQICDERDGAMYPYVTIGKQTWLAKNMNFSANGIGQCYDQSQVYCNAYGRMYRFTEIFCSSDDCEYQWGVVDPDKLNDEVVCPYGWHLPSTGELEELWTYADPNFVPGSEGSGAGNNSAGAKLKITSWSGGTDDYGFAALPGGYCGGGCGAPSNMMQINNISFWWHYGFGSPVPLTKSWRLASSGTTISAPNNGTTVDDAFQSYGTSAFYVRCIKSIAQTTPSPETPPSNLACAGNGTAGQICHLGQWKNTFTDTRDGKTYPYINAGGKTWMAKNLEFNAGEGSVCYNRLDKNCETYGRLYNWNTMMAGETTSSTNPSGVKGVCPQGWHLPSDAEWTTLLAAANGSGTNNLNGASNALKAKSGWEQNGTDDLGFAALPSSYGVSLAGYYSRGGFGTAKGSFFWSATSIAANGAHIRHIGPTSPDAKRIDNDKSRLYSVRCVRD
jgi:uncharacterized protein (TIGR02145 family)